MFWVTTEGALSAQEETDFDYPVIQYVYLFHFMIIQLFFELFVNRKYYLECVWLFASVGLPCEPNY